MMIEEGSDVMLSRSVRARPWCTVVCKIWEVKWEFAGGGVGGSRFECDGYERQGGCSASVNIRERESFRGEANFVKFNFGKQTSDETISRTHYEITGIEGIS
jgi:hypothetical protein